jgi:hypothetical protein
VRTSRVDEELANILEVALAGALRSFDDDDAFFAVTQLNRRRERKPERPRSSW